MGKGDHHLDLLLYQLLHVQFHFTIPQTATRLRKRPSKETNIDELFYANDNVKETEKLKEIEKSKETNIDDVTGHTSSRSSIPSDRYNGW